MFSLACASELREDNKSTTMRVQTKLMNANFSNNSTIKFSRGAETKITKTMKTMKTMKRLIYWIGLTITSGGEQLIGFARSSKSLSSEESLSIV